MRAHHAEAPLAAAEIWSVLGAVCPVNRDNLRREIMK
jgi:hypothetical protein